MAEKKPKKEPMNKSKYRNDWISDTYDRINLTVPKGQKEKIKSHAQKMNESTNGFVNRAIHETMKRDDEQ